MREMEERERVREQAMREMEQREKAREREMREIKEKIKKMEEDPAPKPNEVFGVDKTDFAEMKRSKTGNLWSIKTEPYLKCIFKASKSNGGEYVCQHCPTVMSRKNGRLFLK